MPEVPVNRLLDIVVEEVSLVDRAANKRTFLVVKRDEETPMSDDSNEENNATTPQPDTSPDEDSGGHPLLATAVQALESLTHTVELLQEAAGGQRELVAPLAGQLRTTATRLLEQTGNTAPQSTDGPSFEDQLAAAKQAIAALAASNTKPPPGSEESAQLAKLQPYLASIKALSESFQTLAGTVKHHHTRIAAVEKSHVAPTRSAAVEDAPQPDPFVGWPLDLNEPKDRASVDKRVSFHDL